MTLFYPSKEHFTHKHLIIKRKFIALFFIPFVRTQWAFSLLILCCLTLVLSSPSAPHALSCSPTSKQTTAGSRRAFSPPRRTASTCLSGILFVASARTRSSSCLSMTPLSRPSSGAASLYLPLPHIQAFCISPSLIFSG